MSGKRETYTHRPKAVSDEVMEENWKRIFGGADAMREMQATQGSDVEGSQEAASEE